MLSVDFHPSVHNQKKITRGSEAERDPALLVVAMILVEQL
jgi:hypothetical protein